MRYIRLQRKPYVEATTCPTAARSTAVAISVHTGDAVSRILAAWWKREAICRMSRQEICIAVNRFHRFRSRPWGPNNFATESVSHCDQAALVSCRVVALLRKGPYGERPPLLSAHQRTQLCDKIARLWRLCSPNANSASQSFAG